MKRQLRQVIQKDLDRKLIIISGPRQCGKTTLSTQLAETYDYLNYDSPEDRLKLKAKTWDRKKSLVIFDELHKMRSWKRWLKGIYDTEGIPPGIVVTGSAKMDTYRKVGDSLAGRFFQFHLHPFDLKELAIISNLSPEDCFERLMTVGGFPEPFLENELDFYNRWRQSHTDIMIRQDLTDLASIRDIQAIETLIELLRTRVGSTVSYANLARDLDRDPTSVKRWLQLLETMYVIFKVTPYAGSMTKSLRKAPKYYFYDTGSVEGDRGAKLENLVACALQKELDYLNDTKGIRHQLHFIRTKEGKELDFLVARKQQPVHAIEVKWKDATISPSFRYFQKYLPKTIRQTQLVRELSKAFSNPEGVECEPLVPWLTSMDLML